MRNVFSVVSGLLLAFLLSACASGPGSQPNSNHPNPPTAFAPKPNGMRQVAGSTGVQYYTLTEGQSIPFNQCHGSASLVRNSAGELILQIRGSNCSNVQTAFSNGGMKMQGGNQNYWIDLHVLEGNVERTSQVTVFSDKYQTSGGSGGNADIFLIDVRPVVNAGYPPAQPPQQCTGHCDNDGGNPSMTNVCRNLSTSYECSQYQGFGCNWHNQAPHPGKCGYQGYNSGIAMVCNMLSDQGACERNAAVGCVWQNPVQGYCKNVGSNSYVDGVCEVLSDVYSCNNNSAIGCAWEVPACQ